MIQRNPPDPAELVAMSSLLAHRGPDDEGYLLCTRERVAMYGGDATPADVYASDSPYSPRSPLASAQTDPEWRIALGHRRLSIIDLRPAGHQPMSYRNRYWIAFNGEIYNYVELREELIGLGHDFRSDSDTEVILAAYAQWGRDCLSRFNGMWGLAILDHREGTLFLARDRFGVKPLYYVETASGLAFASEIKAFRALAGWRARANMARAMDFLIWSISDHTAETMFSGVNQLPAGHVLTLRLDAVAAAVPLPQPVRWYELRAKSALTGAAAENALRDAISSAVRLRLRSDVPVGSCLSGGLDSSAIVCLMGLALRSQGGGGQLRTFTAGSADSRFDETAYANQVAAVAQAIGVLTVPEPARLFEDLDRIVWHQDEPFVSTSIFAQWCVFDAARQAGVTVMLDGQGADETFGGYRGFFGAYLASLFRSGHLARWAGELSALKRQIGFSIPRSLGYTAAYAMPGLLGLIGRFDHRAYSDRTWVKPARRAAFSADPIDALGGRSNSVRGMSLAQINATNLPMLLRWEDRNSMAFSVEARVPFLDFRVVELAIAIDDADKVGGGISKAVLRRAMRGIVPDAVLDRKDKMGFVTAEEVWMQRDCPGKFREELAAALDAVPGVLDPAVLRRYDDFVQGRRPFDHRYWRAIALGRWARRFDVNFA